MSRKPFAAPFIGRGMTPTDDVVIGGGSGQSGEKPYPCSFDDWLTAFADDNPFAELDDYRTWWKENGFSESEWNIYNPNDPFNP